MEKAIVPGHGGLRAAVRPQQAGGLGFFPAQWRTASVPIPRRALQVRATTGLDSLSGVVSDKNVPEGHTGLHGFLYGSGGAEEAHDGEGIPSKEFQGRTGEDDGSSVLPLEDYLAARDSLKFPGVYAVYNRHKAVQYIGFSRNVVLSLKTHKARLGEESCGFVRVKLFGDPSLVTKTKLEEEKQRWIDELEEVPEGNNSEDGLWESRAQKAKVMSEKEREEYEDKKLKLRKAMGENLHDDVDGEDDDSKTRRMKLLQAVEGDNWSSVIDGQSMETVAAPNNGKVVSPFEKDKNLNGGGLYSPETYEFTVENVDKVLNEVRPYLIADGGNVAVLSIADGIVSLELQGACGTCPSSTSTMKMGIERVLREKFGEAVKEVVDVHKPSVALTFEVVNEQIDMLRAAVVGYGGVVELATVDPVKGECHVKYKGPVPLGLGIKAAIRDKFPSLNIVLVDP